MWKRGLLSCITIILITLALATFVSSIPADIIQQCNNGEISCGFVFNELGREFICDSGGTFVDASRQAGQTVACFNGDKFLADGQFWILCGNTAVSDTLTFDYIVQRAEFSLSTNPTSKSVGATDLPSDITISVGGPNDVITGVSINFPDPGTPARGKIQGLGIFTATLNKDGTLTQNPNPITQGIPNFDLTVRAPATNQVLTGIDLRFDSLDVELENSLRLTFKEIDIPEKELGEETIASIGNTVDTPEKSITVDGDNQLITSIGVRTFPSFEFGDFDPGLAREVKGISIQQRSLVVTTEVIADNQKTLTLTRDLQDVQQAFTPLPADNVFFIQATNNRNLVQLSFEPNQVVTAKSNPSGQIFARTTISQSNAAKSFADIQHPFPITDSITGTKEFVCFTTDNINHQIKFCADSSGANDPFSQASTGDSFIGNTQFNLVNSRYYCLKDGVWDRGLDDIAIVHDDIQGLACSGARDISIQPSQSLSYTWTGTACCGDDVDESFNDLGDVGTESNPQNALITQRKAACFESFGVPHFRFLDTDQDDDVLVFNGTFQGCNIAAQNFLPSNQDLLTLTDDDNNQLITDNDYCTTFTSANNPPTDITDKTFYCSYEETWKNDALTEETMFLRSIRFDEEDDFTSNLECCPLDRCWTGKSCQPHGTIAPTANEFFCFRGDWKTADEDIFKYTPKREARSLNCAPNQCFAKEPGFEGCVDDGFFLDDFICNQGDWLSRTQAVAETLLTAANSDFSLQCDSFDNVLNYFTYDFLQNPDQQFEQGNIETNFLGAISDPLLCNGDTTNVINNICVLNNGDNVVFGVSLNCPVTMPRNNILEVFGKDGSLCSETGQDFAGYELCTAPRKVFYEDGFAYHNERLNTLIFSPTLISSDLDPTPLCSVTPGFSFIDIFNTYNSICWAELLARSFIRPDTPALLQTFSQEVSEIENFEKLFFAKNGDKSILGVMELGLNDFSTGVPIPTNYLGIFYNNFVGDICGLVRELVGFESDDYNCLKQGPTVEVTAADRSTNRRQLFRQDIWTELTAKSRIRDVPVTRCFPDGCNNNVPILCGADKDPFDTASDPDFDDTTCQAREDIRCFDGVDNNGDGFTDACDPICGIVTTGVSAANFEPDEVSCTDQFDNDCDGLLNAADATCQPIAVSLPLPFVGKGNQITATVAAANGPPASSPDYRWEIIDQQPLEGSNQVCAFGATALTQTTTPDNIDIIGVNEGTCRVRVTDSRNLIAISDPLEVKPALLDCAYAPSTCPTNRPTTVLKLSKRINAFVSVPDSTPGPRICCGISSGSTLRTSTSALTDSDHYASLTAAQNAQMIVLPDTVPGDVELYLQAVDEEIACTPIRSRVVGTGTLPGGGGFIVDNLPEFSNCDQARFDTCLFSTTEATDGLTTDCDGFDDFPVQMCCRVEGSQPTDGCRELERQCRDTSTLQICVGGVFVDQRCGICATNPTGDDDCLFLPILI